jgi:hypothetical protein
VCNVCHLSNRTVYAFRFVGLRALVGGALALGALTYSIGPLEYAWARIYSYLDSRSQYVCIGRCQPFDTAICFPHAVEVRIATRCSWSNPDVSMQHLAVFTPECTGLPVFCAIAPLLVLRWRVVPVLVAVLGATVLTSAVNFLRLWLDYRLMSPRLPYPAMHQLASLMLFGLEVTACALFSFRAARLCWRGRKASTTLRQPRPRDSLGNEDGAQPSP